MKKLKIIILGLILNFSFLWAAQAQESKNAVSLFAQGEIAYKQGDYPAAIKHYEEILESGLESGPLYFNLANSYYKNAELGRAILNYERAGKLLPRDSDLNFNYHYALLQVKNGREEAPSNFLQRFLEGRQFYSLEEMVMILTAVFCLFGIIFLLSLYLKWPVRVRRLTLILLGTLAVIYGVGLVYKIKAEKNSAVVLKESKAKFEPREEATTYFELTEGEKVKIIKQEEEWIKIKREDGKLGWIKKESLEKI